MTLYDLIIKSKMKWPTKKVLKNFSLKGSDPLIIESKYYYNQALTEIETLLKGWELSEEKVTDVLESICWGYAQNISQGGSKVISKVIASSDLLDEVKE